MSIQLNSEFWQCQDYFNLNELSHNEEVMKRRGVYPKYPSAHGAWEGKGIWVPWTSSFTLNSCPDYYMSFIRNQDACSRVTEGRRLQAFQHHCVWGSHCWQLLELALTVKAPPVESGQWAIQTHMSVFAACCDWHISEATLQIQEREGSASSGMTREKLREEAYNMKEE